MSSLQIDDLIEQFPGVTWSVSVWDLQLDRNILDHLGDTVLKTASVPKIFLLWDVSYRLSAGHLKETDLIDRRNTIQVQDSGVWQYLKTDILPIMDTAALIGAFSDNLATNALLDVVGLDSVAASARKLGCTDTRLNDYVRDERIPGAHPDTISQGSSQELALVCATQDKLAQGGDVVASQLIDWLRRGVDYSMVLRDFGLDPLSHYAADQGIRVWNKTGTDLGVRADIGVIEAPSRSVAYSVIANWNGSDMNPRHVLSLMGAFGLRLRDYCQGLSVSSPA